MTMFDFINGKLNPETRSGYENLFREEVNVFLKKIYSKLGKRMKWKPIQLSKHQFELKDTSSSESKQWIVKLMPPENIKIGDIGKVVVTSNRVSWDILRNQRALMIAAELYVFHAFALDKNPAELEGIKIQNHYIDMWRLMTGKRSHEHTRDKAIQYIMHEIGEEKLAMYSPKGLWIKLKSLDSHDKKLAKILGVDETTFEKVRQNDKKYSSRDLIREDIILKTEISHIEHLISLLNLDESDRKKLGQKVDILNTHIASLKSFRRTLTTILKHKDLWEHKNKSRHRELKKSPLKFEYAHRSARLELSRHRVDMTKIYIVIKHFQKEKINILRDLEVLNKTLKKTL